MKWPRLENWKAETQLKEVAPDEVLFLVRAGQPVLRITPRELQRDRRINGELTVAEVERYYLSFGAKDKKIKLSPQGNEPPLSND